MSQKIEKTLQPLPNVTINIHIDIHTQGENTQTKPFTDTQTSFENSIAEAENMKRTQMRGY